MPPEVEKLRTVPKYRIVAQTLDACPMFARAKVHVYEIRGNIGRYRHIFDLKTSLEELESFDRDLEQFVVALPGHVKDMSKEEFKTEKFS
jgi:hypothetical protein